MSWKNEATHRIYAGPLWEATYSEELASAIARTYLWIDIMTTWVTGITAGGGLLGESWAAVQVATVLALVHGLASTYMGRSGVQEIPDKLSELGRKLDLLMAEISSDQADKDVVDTKIRNLVRELAGLTRNTLLPRVFFWLTRGAEERARNRLETGYVWQQEDDPS